MHSTTIFLGSDNSPSPSLASARPDLLSDPLYKVLDGERFRHDIVHSRGHGLIDLLLSHIRGDGDDEQASVDVAVAFQLADALAAVETVENYAFVSTVITCWVSYSICDD